MPLPTGQILNNRYRIVKLLGQGGFGAVYRAWDTNLNIPVALKENFDTSPAAARQFAQEANFLAALRHPHLPKVTDHFSLPNQGQYLVMEYVDGEDLSEKVDQAGGPLPEAQALAWMEQILDALAYLHTQDPPIIHRDVKPDNICITGQGQAILVDFGIAKYAAPGQRTATAARAVTPGYSPIENYGQGSTDARSDIYALGATLYCVLAGHSPPDSIERTTGTPLPPLRQVNPQVSPQVEAAVQKAMELQPVNRFGSARQFADALRAPPEPVHRVQPTAAIGPTWDNSPGAPLPAAYTTAELQTEVSFPAYAPETKRPQPSLAKIVLAGGGMAAVAFAAAAAAFVLWLVFRPSPLATPVSPGVVVLPTATAVAPTTVRVSSATPAAAALPTRPPPTQPPPTRTATQHRPPTPIPPPTEVPLPPGPLQILLDTGYHCRGGPGDGYEILRDLNAGTQLELIGRSADWEWYLVRLNDPSTRKKLCWITGGEVQGNPGALPVCTWTGDGYTENYSCSP